ncbi:RNA-binding protein [Algirhabdus cladophorae]|uniref:RNA-binding protein n=1 Tax=Algirhabdus cladophorae TaxID=3377108 RepID=UPI003B845C78
MGRGGQPKRLDAPERKCIGTGEVLPKDQLIRFVVGPEGQVVPDLRAKLPGRGLYLVASQTAFAQAIKKGAFARAAKMQVKVPDDLAALVEAGLARQMVDLISLSRKAGSAVCGFEKVKNALANDMVKVLVQASDGSERGKTKLWTPEGARYFGMLTQQELGLAFGRESVIHGALVSGGLTQRVIETALKLRGLRETDAKTDGGHGPLKG